MGSIWVPILALGWFLLMTLVGWQVSRREPQRTSVSPPGDNPSEFDRH